MTGCFLGLLYRVEELMSREQVTHGHFYGGKVSICIELERTKRFDPGSAESQQFRTLSRDECKI